MSRPWPHPKTGVFWFRRRIPKDFVALVGRREEKASLGTKDVGEAKRRHAAHAALVEQRWANLRIGVRLLNILEINAVAGEVYEALIPKFQAGQFSPFFNLMAAGVIERYIKDCSPKNRNEFLRFYGGEIDAHLARKGLVVDPETRGGLEFAIAKAILQAVEQSEKYLVGDFSPDPRAGRFPELPDKLATLVLPLDEWFAKYAEESKLAASTRKRWRPALATLEASVGHDDLARVTPDEVSDWVDALRAQVIGPHGVAQVQNWCRVGL